MAQFALGLHKDTFDRSVAWLNHHLTQAIEHLSAGVEEGKSIDAATNEIWGYIERGEVDTISVYAWAGASTWSTGYSEQNKGEIRSRVRSTVQFHDDKVFVKKQGRTVIVTHNEVNLKSRSKGAGLEEGAEKLSSLLGTTDRVWKMVQDDESVDLSAALEQFKPEMEMERMKARMPGWLEAVVSPEEFLELVYRVHDPVIMGDRIAVLPDSELLPERQRDPLSPSFSLWGMAGNLRGIFGWSENTELRIDPWSQETEADYRKQGYRIVRLRRDPNDSRKDPIPQELLLFVLSRAVASGEEVFRVDVTHGYLKLRGLNDHEIRTQLTDLFA